MFMLVMNLMEIPGRYIIRLQNKHIAELPYYMKQLAVLQKDSANQCTVYLTLIFFIKYVFFCLCFYLCPFSFVSDVFYPLLCPCTWLGFVFCLWVCLYDSVSVSVFVICFFFVTLNNELFRNDKEIKQENTSPCYRPTSPRFTDQETKRDLSPLSTHRLLYLYLNPYHIEPNKVEIDKEGMWQGKIISAGLFSISQHFQLRLSPYLLVLRIPVKLVNWGWGGGAY